MHGSRSNHSLDRSDLDFYLSLDLDLGGRIFKTAITRSIFELGPPDFRGSRPRQSLDISDLDFDLSLDLDLGGQKLKTDITQLLLNLGAQNFVWKET